MTYDLLPTLYWAVVDINRSIICYGDYLCTRVIVAHAPDLKKKQIINKPIKIFFPTSGCILRLGKTNLYNSIYY